MVESKVGVSFHYIILPPSSGLRERERVYEEECFTFGGYLEARVKHTHTHTHTHTHHTLIYYHKYSLNFELKYIHIFSTYICDYVYVCIYMYIFIKC